MAQAVTNAQLQQMLGEQQAQFQAALSQQQQLFAQQLQQMQQLVAAGAAHAGPHHGGPNLRFPKPDSYSALPRESPPNHLHQVETYLTAYGVDLNTTAAVTHAAGFLAGSALKWYRLHLNSVATGLEADFPNFEAYEQALISKFAPAEPEREARNRLEKLRQTGSAREYARNFITLMLDIPEMREKDRLEKFMRGLKPHLRLQLELKGPSTLQRALEWAVRIDQLMWDAQHYRSGNFASNSSSGNNSGANNGPAPMELGAAEPKPSWRRNAPGQHSSGGNIRNDTSGSRHNRLK